MISGGYPSHGDGQYHNKRVELYNLVNKTSCSLPNMPKIRGYHTSVDGVVCGGYVEAEQRSCIEFTGGSWSSSQYQPIEKRSGHSSWNMNPGESLMLLGRFFNYKRDSRIILVIIIR